MKRRSPSPAPVEHEGRDEVSDSPAMEKKSTPSTTVHEKKSTEKSVEKKAAKKALVTMFHCQ